MWNIHRIEPRARLAADLLKLGINLSIKNAPLSGRPLHVLQVLVPGVKVRPQLQDDQLLLSHQLSLPPDHLHTRQRGRPKC